MPFASYVMQATCFFTIGFFVFGPQMLIGMAAAECSHKEAAGAATGFVGLFAYLGASLAGWPLAKVLDTALERILWLSPSPPGFPHCYYCPFERPDTARSVMHLTFSLHIRQN